MNDKRPLFNVKFVSINTHESIEIVVSEVLEVSYENFLNYFWINDEVVGCEGHEEAHKRIFSFVMAESKQILITSID